MARRSKRGGEGRGERGEGGGGGERGEGRGERGEGRGEREFLITTFPLLRHEISYISCT